MIGLARRTPSTALPSLPVSAAMGFITITAENYDGRMSSKLPD